MNFIKSYLVSFSITMILLMSSFLLATDYYVSPDGNDTNGLSWATAWNDIQFAIDNVENPTTASITIHLSADIFVLDNYEIEIDRSFIDLTISGVLASSTFIQPVAEGLASSRNFLIEWENVVTLENMTIRNGHLPYLYDCGAGILNYGTLTVRNCTIKDNSVLLFGAGIWSDNDLTIDQCEISSNSITWEKDYSQGAGIYVEATSGVLSLEITNTTISGNTADVVRDTQGVGIYLRTTRSTTSIDAIITNCTIANNENLAEEGIEGKGLFLNNSGSMQICIVNCIFDNGSDFNYGVYGEGELTLNRCNTICCDESMPLGREIGNLNSTDPLLGELSLNNSITGTYTHDIDPLSPAFDGGTCLSSPIIDQRGIERDDAPDIGALEYTDDSPLPVTLSDFSAAYVNTSSLVSWATQSENNNLGWNVYRSSNQNFTVSTVQNSDLIEGAGTTTMETEYEFTDPYEVENATSYWYWLESISFSGESELYGPIFLTVPIGGNGNNLPVNPEDFGLKQNYPNPFNPSTEINFSLPISRKCEIIVYDVTGRIVTTLFSGNIEAETVYSVLWDSRDKNGIPVASGIYYYKMKAGSYSYTRKMILLK